MSDQPSQSMADSILDEALTAGVSPGEGQEDEAAPAVDEQPRQRSGGLQPLIAQKKRQIKEIEDKLLNPNESGAYTRTNEHGGRVFDYVAMQQDQVRLNRLRDELSELRERDRDQQTLAQQRNDQARRMARDVLNSELAKMPEGMRKQVGEIFAQIFQQMMNAGSFAKQDMADRNALRAVLNQIVDTAYGNALRRQQQGDSGQQGAPAPANYDEGDEVPEKNQEEEEDDPFTKSLMAAYDRKRSGRMTVAEMKRQQAAAQSGGKSE